MKDLAEKRFKHLEEAYRGKNGARHLRTRKGRGVLIVGGGGKASQPYKGGVVGGKRKAYLVHNKRKKNKKTIHLFKLWGTC